MGQFMKKQFPESKSDLFAAFIERVETMVRRHGFMAQVTMQSWMFLSSYEKLRKRLQRDASIVAMLHMGNMVMRIAFGTSATIWEVGGDPRRLGKYTYIEAADLDGDQPHVFPARNQRTQTADRDGFFAVPQEDFAVIPGFPIAYWLSEKMRAAFVKAGGGVSLGDTFSITKGITTGNNGRFLRLWWEVSQDESEFRRHHDSTMPTQTWQAADKGGDFRRWFGNNDWVIYWPNDGHEIVNFAGSTPRNIHTRFRPSIACTKISSGDISFRAHDRGFVFTDAAVAAIGDSNLDAVLGFVNSVTANHMIAALAPTLNFEVGQVRSLPYLVYGDDEEAIRDIVTQLKANSTEDWNSFETSWSFRSNPLVAPA